MRACERACVRACSLWCKYMIGGIIFHHFVTKLLEPLVTQHHPHFTPLSFYIKRPLIQMKWADGAFPERIIRHSSRCGHTYDSINHGVSDVFFSSDRAWNDVALSLLLCTNIHPPFV